MKQLIIFLFILIPGFVSCQQYIGNAFSADDHKRKRPLMEAIEAGFAGVSADLSLSKDGVLKCGGKPLDELYLKPLMKLSDQNNGHIYAGIEEEFYLVLNVVSDSIASFAAIEKLAGIYPGLFSKYDNGVRTKKAVRLILSGNIPVTAMVNLPVRSCFPDENIKSLKPQWDGRYIVLATLNYKKVFDWNGEQNMSNMSYMSFISYVKNAHKAGRLVRLQNAPESVNSLGIFLEAGVDFIDVEDIPAFLKYWRNR